MLFSTLFDIAMPYQVCVVSVFAFKKYGSLKMATVLLFAKHFLMGMHRKRFDSIRSLKCLC